jgi:hypothetical protein
MGRKPATWTRVDRDYETLRIDMQTLFHDPRHHARRSSRINNILSMAEMQVSSQARPAGRGRRWVPAPRRRPRQLRRAAVIATVLS